MGSQHQVGQLEQGMVSRQGLRLGYVERGACNPAFSEGGIQGGRINDRSAGGIDEHGVLSHQPHLRLSDESLGLFCERYVQRDEVRLSQKAFEFGILYRKGLLALQVAVAVVVENSHIEAAGAAGNLFADSAHADDAQRAAVDLEPRELARVVVGEAGAPGETVPGHDIARRGQQEGHGHVGGDPIDGARRIAYGDAAGRAGSDVDMIDANPEIAHHQEVRQAIEKLAAYFVVAVGVDSPDRGQGRAVRLIEKAPGEDLAVRLQGLQQEVRQRYV